MNNTTYVIMIVIMLIVAIIIFYISRKPKNALDKITIPVNNSVPSNLVSPPIVVPVPKTPFPSPATPPSVPSPIVPPTPKIVMAFDIDKTLTNAVGNTGIPITDLKPYQPMLDKAKQAEILVIATARENKYKNDTITWLTKIGLKPDLILTRELNDTRPDPDVKYDEMMTIRTRYPSNPIVMHDDKPENCAAVIKVPNVTCVHVVQ